MIAFRLRIASALALSLLASSARPTTAAPPDPKAGDKVFVGYLYGPHRDLKFDFYTHICHAFITSDGDGNLGKTPNVPDRGLTSSAHKAGVKVLVSLGGWGYDQQFGSIVAKPEAEDRYVKAVMEIVDGSDYDGIDLDWEYPDTKAEIVGFERLSRRFRKLLDELGTKKSRPMFLTMAAAANPGTLSWLGKDFLLETMDWVNVMTYDFAGDWSSYAGHNSPLHASSKQPKGDRLSTEASLKHLVEDREIPANRLAVGIPLYGKGFSVAEPYASIKGVPRSKFGSVTYRNLVKMIGDQGWTRQWNDETKTPWLFAPDKKAVIGYDDAESVGLKAEWAMKQGFRGVFFWEIGQDRLPDGSNPLQEAARKAWLAGGGK